MRNWYYGGDHPEVPVCYPFYRRVILVDEEVAPLLQAAWALGIATVYSCQEDDQGMADIGFLRPVDVQCFLAAVFRRQDSFYKRCFPWFNESEGQHWEFELTVGEAPKFNLRYRVAFPRRHMNEVEKRLLAGVRRDGRQLKLIRYQRV